MSITIKRKKTRKIKVGNVDVGGNAPISVQSMTNTPTADIKKTASQIRRLEKAGCDIIRVAVPDMDAANAIKTLKTRTALPIIADIHFDHKLALAAMASGCDALRINPGNIGSKTKIKTILNAAKDTDVAIRIGVNAGSLEKDLLKKYKHPTAEAMVESAMRHIALFHELDFQRIKLSIKASDVLKTIEAYRLLSKKTNHPLHVGVTEAGSLYSGSVKSAIGIGMLLAEGIGDTLRVSLTRDPVEEIRVGYEILKALSIRRVGPEIISCPTCGRCNIKLFDIVDKVEKKLLTKKLPIKIAIMGCVVNGPGEAKEADIGIAGGNGIGILFAKGKVIKKFPEKQLVDVLIKEVEKYERNESGK